MKKVALGVAGSWADDKLEVADHYTTKVGGLPDWPFPESSLPRDLLQCNSCKSNLCLIAQVYAPIAAAVKIEERVIYVFGCTVAHCGSWRAFRVQKPDKIEEPKFEKLDSKWWDDLYSFETGSDNAGQEEDLNMEDLARALSEAANLSSGSVKNSTRRHTKTYEKPPPLVPKAREVDSSTLVLPCFYIRYQEGKSSSAFPSKSLLSVDESKLNKDGDHLKHKESWNEENFEYDKALSADRTFLKFKKKVDECPEQCLRYSFRGKPLSATGGASDPGPCDTCGESRHYEMQLMPQLVYFLQEGAVGAERELLNNWNWMTLIVSTCSKSCFQKLDQETSDRNGWTVIEETVIAQCEQASDKLSSADELTSISSLALCLDNIYPENIGRQFENIIPENIGRRISSSPLQ